MWVKFPGPKDTVYENETFELKVRFDDMYPFSPPRLQLMTAIYHPNIDKGKEITKSNTNLCLHFNYIGLATNEKYLHQLEKKFTLLHSLKWHCLHTAISKIDGRIFLWVKGYCLMELFINLGGF